MKTAKRITSVFLVLVLVLSMLSTAAFAAGSDYSTRLLVEKTDTDTVDVKWMVQTSNGAVLKTTNSIFFKYDNTQYDMLTNDGTVITTKTMSVNLFGEYYDAETFTQNVTTLDTPAIWGNSGIYAEAKGNWTFVLINLATGIPAASKQYTTETQLAVVHLKLKSGTVDDGLPGGSIALATKDEANNCSQSGIVIFIGAGEEQFIYGNTSGATDTLLTTPVVAAGEGVTFAKPAYSGAAATVTKVEKSGSNVAVTATVPSGEKAQYGYSNEDDASKVTNWQDSNSFAEPTTPGTYYFFARVKASDDHQAGGVSSGYAYTVYGPLSLSYPAPAAALTIGDGVSLTPNVSGGSGTYSSYAVTDGTLPGGLSIDTGTGVISGTLTTAGAASSVTVTVTDSVSNIKTATISFPAVEKKTNTVTFTSPKTEFVEGQTVSFTATATSGTPSYTYQKSGEAEWTHTVPTAVGSYTVKASVEESTDYKASEATHEFRIIAKAVSSIAVTGPTKTTYVVGQTLDTAGMKVVVTYNDASTGTINAGEFETKGVTITGFNSAAPAASQTVTVTYGGKSGTFTVTIEARALISIEVTTQPSKTTGYVAFDTLDTTGMVVTATYNDGTETISAANFAAKGVTISYSGDNTSFRAGETKATVNFGGKQADVTVDAVGKATLDTSSVDWSGSTSVPYDGSSHSVVLTNLPTGVTVSSYQDNVKTYVGSYTAKANLSYDTDNYEMSKAIPDYSWSINKVAQTLSSGNTSTETAFSLKKGGNIVDLTTLVSTNAVGNTLSFTLDAVTYATLGADGKTLTSTDTTGTVKITVSADAYNVDGSGADEFDAATSIDIYVNVVNKDTDTDTLSVSQDSFTYGEGTVNPVVSNEPETAGEVSFSYVGRNETSYSGSIPPTNAGDYTVTATCEDAGTIYTASADFSINRKSISGMTVTLSETSKEYNGGSQSVTVTSVGSLNPASDYNVVSGTSGSNADTYTVTVEGKGNYTGTASTNWRITPKAIAISGATASDRDYVKDDKSVVISGVTFTDATLAKGTDYTVTGEMDDANAGSGKTVNVTVTLTGSAATNYTLTPNTTTTTVTINKIDYTISTPITGSAKYGTTGSVDLSSYLKDGYVIGTITKTNESIFESNPSMDGTSLKFTFTNVSGNAGQTAEITVPVTSTTNYNSYDIKVAVTVNAKTVPTVTAPVAKTNLTYNGAAQALISAGATNGGEMQYSLTSGSGYSTAIPTATNANTYTVYYKVVGDSEYADVAEASVSVTIAKKDVTVAPKSFTITKGSAIPTFELVYTGLVGSDTLTPSDTPVFTCYEADGTTPVSTTTAAGAYTITWTNEGATTFTGADNYNVTKTATGTLTINNPAPSGGGGGVSTYAITVDSAKNGTVTVSPKSAAKGATVTITVKPDKGFELDTLKVVDKNGDKVKVTEKNGKFTFTMPASKVTIKATFAEIVVAPENPFVDVPANAYYYDAVLWAAENGITGGVDATHFAPNATCTRAQAVTFLWRAAGSPAPKSSENPFTDVKAGSYYYDAVLWAVENGITNGTSATAFSPNATCSRAQIVTFLWRSQKSPAADTVNPFTDVAADSYYANAVVWAAENGITGGTSATTFSPSNNCTRAQIVTFLFRCLGE